MSGRINPHRDGVLRRVFALCAIFLVFLSISSGGVAGSAAKDPKQPKAKATYDALLAIFPEGVRDLSGAGYNAEHPNWGKSGTQYLRVAPANYADGVGAMVGGPSPRYVSNRIFNDLSQNLFSENNVTQWGFTWGQFLDHTFGLRDAPGEHMPIQFDSGDPLEGFRNDFGMIDFARSKTARGTGIDSPREQINTVSSWIDSWAVYGGSAQRLEWLREGPVDGDLSNNSALLVLADGYLPGVNARGDAGKAPTMELMGRLMGAPADARVAGDVRANENIALTSVHTLFAREHNRIVRALPDKLDQEVKFEIARRLVSAEQQFITYNEFLPALGVKLGDYDGYKPGVNASLSNEFAVVGYRAHSMIHGEIEMLAKVERYTPQQLEELEDNGVEIAVEEGKVELAVPLNVAFGNPGLVEEIGLGPILVGLGSEAQYKNDEQIDNQLRSVLFQIPGPGVADPHECLDGAELSSCFATVLDLGAIDIARGRDHGMPYYNDMRKAYGLAPKGSFVALTGENTEEFPSDPEIDAANPLNDPSILDVVQLRDIDGNVLEPGSDEADEGAVTEVRRTTVAARLKALYGDVNKVDAFVGMVAEPHLAGVEFGELQLAMWKKQFEALRGGDKFFYLNDPALGKIKERFGLTYRHRLADIIAMNTELEHGNLQPNLFKLGRGPAALTGTRLNDKIRGFSGPDTIRSGRGDDMVRGGRGKDVIFAGAGSDKVWGGKDSDLIRGLAGDDWIDVRDGARDWVYCGKGQDVVMADRMDRVAGNCETVKRTQ